jgi:hypothetical protein
VTAAELQAMTARLFVDRAFREWFRHAPRDAARGYLLSAEETDMISAVDDERLAVYADSLRERRRQAIATAYPLSRMVAGDDFERYADRYCDLNPGLPERERVLGFGNYLRECLEAEVRLPCFARDLAIYERHLVDLRGLTAARFPTDTGVSSGTMLSLSTVDSWGAAGRLDGSLSTVADLDADRDEARPWLSSRPRLASWARVAVFDYDIPEIVADLERTGVPPAASPTPTGVVMRRVGERTTPEIFRIEVRVAAMLLRCTGEPTVAALAEQCRLDPERLAALLASLATMQVIACW